MSQTLEPNITTTNAVTHSQTMRSRCRVFARLLWKELLALRAFAGLVAAMLLATCGLLWVWQPVVSETVSLLLVSLPQLVSIVFAIGCGAMLFSQEDESGTVEFLRGRGVSPRSIVNAKLTVGLTCLVLLVVTTTLIRWQPASAPELTSGDVMIAITSCSVGLVVLLWTSLCSMALRRELPTVCGGLLGAALLKPFVEQWEVTGLLVLSAVLSSGLWLLCQVAASRWLGTGGWWWRTNRGAMTSDASAELASDGVMAMPNVVRDERAIPVVAGGMIVVGMVLAVLLMMCRPQTDLFAYWPEWFEMLWSLLLSSVLGWMPVRLEQRRVQQFRPAERRDWRQIALTGSVTWLLLWWLLSFGLLFAYRSNSDFSDLTVMSFCRSEVVPGSLVMCCSVRLMTRLCSGRWTTWPLSLLAIVVGWCAWWLLTMLSEPGWLGLLLLAATFASGSLWHRRLTQRGASLPRANLFAGFGVVFSIGLFWGLLNWWRVAEIPTDWTGGEKPTAIEMSPVLDEGQLAELKSQLAELASLIQPVPLVPWTENREGSCYRSDWAVMDGLQNWNQVSEATEAWVEANASAIQILLRLGEPDRQRLLRQSLFAEIASRGDLPHNNVRLRQLLAESAHDIPMGTFALCLLAAKRCEAAGQLDEAGRLCEVSKVFFQIKEEQPRDGIDYGGLLLHSYHGARMAVWIDHPEQTSARLKRSIQEWLQDLANVPPLEILLTEQFRALRNTQSFIAHSDQDKTGMWSWERSLFRRLCPQEELRERRIIDGLEQAHYVALEQLRPLTRDLSTAFRPQVVAEAPSSAVARPSWLIPARSQLTGRPSKLPPIRGQATVLIARTIRFSAVRERETNGLQLPVNAFLNHVKFQRALLTLAAARAFELDHQRPPNSSSELVPDYLPQPPVCVVTGDDVLEQSRHPGNRRVSDDPQAIVVWWRVSSPNLYLHLEPRPDISFDRPPRL